MTAIRAFTSAAMLRDPALDAFRASAETPDLRAFLDARRRERAKRLGRQRTEDRGQRTEDNPSSVVRRPFSVVWTPPPLLSLFRLSTRLAREHVGDGRWRPWRTPGGPRARAILRMAAEISGVSVATLQSPLRTAGIVAARQAAMWTLRRLTRLTLPRLGLMFGGRDHTTALNALTRVELALAGDETARAEIAAAGADPERLFRAAWEARRGMKMRRRASGGRGGAQAARSAIAPPLKQDRGAGGSYGPYGNRLLPISAGKADSPPPKEDWKTDRPPLSRKDRLAAVARMLAFQAGA